MSEGMGCEPHASLDVGVSKPKLRAGLAMTRK
jgi:hypothetical protein